MREGADRVQVGLTGLLRVGSRCVNTPTSLPPESPRQISLDGLSRATASGMTNFGKQDGVSQRQEGNVRSETL